MGTIAWCILIKHFIPQILLILFVNGASAQIDVGGEMKSIFGHYEGKDTFSLFFPIFTKKTSKPFFISLLIYFVGYPASPYQVIGILTVAMTAVAFLVGFVVPDVYKALTTNTMKRKQTVILRHTPYGYETPSPLSHGLRGIRRHQQCILHGHHALPHQLVRGT